MDRHLSHRLVVAARQRRRRAARQAHEVHGWREQRATAPQHLQLR